MSKSRPASSRPASAASSAAAAPPREGPVAAELRETLFLALPLLALFVVPWGPVGAAGARFAWTLWGAHPLEAVPALLGPCAGLVLLLGLRWCDVRSRELLGGLLGLLLLAAGLSETSTLVAARGLGPALLLGAALAALSHRLRLFGELPRLSRLLPLVSLGLVVAHFLGELPDGKETVLRAELFWRFASGAAAIPQGSLAFEAMLLYYPVLVVGSAATALLGRPASGVDRFLAFAHAYAVPGMLLVASVPHFLYMPPSHATGFLAVAVAAALGTQLVLRHGARAALRAARGEYALPSERPLFARLVLTGAGGLCLVFAYPLFDQPHLAWVALVPTLFVVTRAATPRRAFAYGLWTGLVANFGCFYWVGELLVQFAGLPMPVAQLVSLVLAAYSGLVFGLWGYLVRRLQGTTALPLGLVAALLFTGLEFLWWELFPWYVGNSQYLFLPVIQLAELTGPSGLTFLVVLVAFAFHDGLRAVVLREAFPRRLAFGAAAALLLTVGYGLVRLEQVRAEVAAAPKLRVGVAQADVRIKEDQQAFRTKLKRQEQQVRDLTARGAELVVLPESAVPYSFPRDVTRAPSLASAFGGVPVVFGAASSDEADRQYNTAFLLERDGSIAGRYDKNYPLLFGEYLPLMDQPWMQWVRKAFPYASFLTPGSEVETFDLRGHKLGVMICYEDILPRHTRRLADQRPNLLLNLTNDAWFAGSAEPAQHFALSVLRAVEHRLTLVRSVRTGISGFVDATGKIYARTPELRPATLLEEAALMPGGTVYGAVGDLFAYLVLGACAGVVALAVLRGRRARVGAPATQEA